MVKEKLFHNISPSQEHEEEEVSLSSRDAQTLKEAD